jgi:hypothetical protein
MPGMTGLEMLPKLKAARLNVLYWQVGRPFSFENAAGVGATSR